MIDIEMAEEWIKELSLGTSMDTMQIEYYCRRAFLAGLKAGRPVWHDLRKNPNELPKRMRKSILSRTVLNQIGTPCHYNYELECWQNWSYIEIDTPIAWGEIPTFDKE